MLDLGKFLKEVKDADMFVMFRPGPYICAEWEMGGFPAWLLQDTTIDFRIKNDAYFKATEKWFTKLGSVIHEHLFMNGGSIIAVQVENEYGEAVTNKNRHEHMIFLHDTLKKIGINELLYTCDNQGGLPGVEQHGGVPGVLVTANFNQGANSTLQALANFQKNKPLYVAEYWTGWFDNWGDKHHTRDLHSFAAELEAILFTMNSSVNQYMFHGGTNFGFMNGGRVITSYDYYAPLSEAGDYTDLYWKTKELIDRLHKERNVQKFKTPPQPKETGKGNYGKVNVTEYLPFESIVNDIKPIESKEPLQMEMLKIGKNYGQSYGFILYRTTVPKFKNLRFAPGVDDRAIIMIDGKDVATIEWDHNNHDPTFNITNDKFSAQGNNHILDILVENTGRENGGALNRHRKGINGKVYIDDNVKYDWKMYPMEFKKDFVIGLNRVNGWKKMDGSYGPILTRATLNIDGTPKDTFVKVEMSAWHKGNIFVNGINIGRYWDWGPQQTLYIPAPFLKTGKNEILVFEQYFPSRTLEFLDKPILNK
jgi:beta-galactosidase GanA